MFFEEDGLDHEGYCIRPPSEANSILLQATLGCSHNKCTFCDAFKNKRFGIKPQATWERDLEYASKHYRNHKRMFIMDGDAFVMPMKRWEWLLTNIKEKLPWVERVSTFANSKGIALKSDADLARLRELGLSMVYIGIESGHAGVLERVKKGATPEKLIHEAKRLKAHGFVLSLMVLLGLGEVKESFNHAKTTGELLSAIDPEYVGALSLMIMPGTPLHQEYEEGKFELIDQRQMLEELGVLLKHTNLTNGLFMSNHASNYLPIKARLPQEKEANLARIAEALKGNVWLRDEWMRAF